MSARKPPGETTLTRFAGLVIMAMGIGLMALTGLCSAVVLIDFVATNQRGAIVEIAYGAVPALVAAALLYYLGRFLRRW